MRNALLVIHILSAGTWIGANATQFVVTPSMRRVGGDVAAGWMRALVRMGRFLYGPASILLLATGSLMVIDSTVYEFSNTFVLIGIGAVVAGGALGGTVFGPLAERLAERYESGAAGPEVESMNRRLFGFGILDTAIVGFAVVAMVSRWGL